MSGGYDQIIEPFLWRAERIHPQKEIVSRADEGVERYGYREYAERTRRLANALDDAGVEKGDRVATFGWNHSQHFETYFGVPKTGSQLHTVNPLLPEEHIEYIFKDAGDKVVFVDSSLVPKLEEISLESVELFVLMNTKSDTQTSLEPSVTYESFIRDKSPNFDSHKIQEDDPLGLCYTSGTTGKPKGVEYTHKMVWSHTMATISPQALCLRETDVVMPVVPMFHVNAWGLPYSATAAGAKHVYPGESPETVDLVELIEREEVTVSAGVPTVWLGVLEHLEEKGREVDISSLERIIVGGSAAPESMIRRFDELGVEVIHSWGMTEMTPVGTISRTKSKMDYWSLDERYAKRKKQGLIIPGLEFKVVDESGDEVEWDGESFGELVVRGPWVATEYFGGKETGKNGWLETGDIATVDEEGYIKIVDRAKDVIKSGGEWISSVELENLFMGHDEISESAVVGVPDEKWGERPVGYVVKTEKGGSEKQDGNENKERIREELVKMVKDEYPEWWLPEEIIFVDEIPKTATGKFDKKKLREK